MWQLLLSSTWLGKAHTLVGHWGKHFMVIFGLFIFGGYTHQCTGVTPGFLLRDYSPWAMETILDARDST